ncbi:hypothetical protein Tco_1460889 [Tanacetum coccineum]
MGTKRKLLPKSNVEGLARGNTTPENVSDAAPQVRTPEGYSLLEAIVSDETATISITCFSNQANSLIKDVHELLAEISDKKPYHLPQSLKQLEGSTHTFQFYFDIMSTSRRPDFVLDTVFPNIPLALPAPPLGIPMEHPELILHPPSTQILETPNPDPTAVPIIEPQPQITTNVPHTTSDTTPIQLPNPLSPALSTTASNEPDIN